MKHTRKTVELNCRRTGAPRWLLAVLLGGAISGDARFCTKVDVTGTITRGDQLAINDADGRVLEVQSVKTDSRLVQRADIQMEFTIPEAVALNEIAAMHLTVTAQASMPHILTLLEAFDFKKEIWVAVDSFEIDIEQGAVDTAIASAAHYIDPKRRTLLLRLRTKKESDDAYYVKLDAIGLVGIRPEGLKDFGELIAVPADGKAAKDSFAAKIKTLKDDWDKSFDRGGRLNPIGDWESTVDHQEKMKADWRRNWTRNGKVRSLESQLR